MSTTAPLRPRKAQIDRTATALFRAQGFAATSMRELATALGLEAASDGLDLVLGWRDGSVEAAWHVRLHPERSGYAREKAVLWWRGLGGGRDAPMSSAGFLERADRLVRPVAIRIRPGRLTEQIECRAEDGRILGDTRRRSGRAA